MMNIYYKRSMNDWFFLQGRIYEGKEPPQFVALFQPMIILKVLCNDVYKMMYVLEEKNSVINMK